MRLRAFSLVGASALTLAPLVFALLFLGSGGVVLAEATGARTPTVFSRGAIKGPLVDATCNAEDVEAANDNQLGSILEELVETTFFRLVRINMESNSCPFWNAAEKAAEATCSGGLADEDEPDAPPACSITAPDSGSPFSSSGFGGGAASPPPPSLPIAWSPATDRLDKTLSSNEVGYIEETSSEGCNDDSLPEFWLDLCSGISLHKGAAQYVNLRLNPESWTGYNGSAVWASIYDENCFSRVGGRDSNNGGMCYEERILYRLLSGMHAATNIHIAKKYHPPSKRKGRETWESKPSHFVSQYGDKPGQIANLHFSFVVLSRAVQKAASFISSYPFDATLEDAARTEKLVRRLVESSMMKSCSNVFGSFDETRMFTDPFSNTTTLKRQFKQVFLNISHVLDCVSCHKCRLHGKISMLGLGAALKILMLPSDMLTTSVSRDELVALINTLAKTSVAMKSVKELKLQYVANEGKRMREEQAGGASSAPTQPQKHLLELSRENLNQMDAILDAVGKLRSIGALSPGAEDALVDLTMAAHPSLILLSKHYLTGTAEGRQTWLRHVLRNLDAFGAPVALGGSPGFASAPLGDASNPADAVVVGGGLAGLTATLSILDRGGSVVLVEKEAFVGGNSAKASSGINGVDPLPHRAPAFGDSIEVFRSDMVKSSGYQPNDRSLMNTLVEGSGDALEWVRKRIKLDLDKVGQLGGHSKQRTYRPAGGLAGAEIIFAMSKIVKQLAKDIPKRLVFLKNTRVSSLIQNDQGSVEGVRASKRAKKGDSTGVDVSVHGRSVVLATGGYGNDKYGETGLLKKHRPDIVGLATTNAAGTTGDGHKIAFGIGAGASELSNVQVHPTGFIDPRKPDSKTKTLCAELLRGVGGILLNKDGRRFVNELDTRANIVARMQQQESDSETLAFTILLNAESAAEADKHVPLYSSKGLLKQHETLESVASAIGVDVSTLRREVAAYNSDAKRGSDRFGKSVFNHAPWRVGSGSGPYFLGTVTPVVHYTMGGVKADSSGRVLRGVTEEPIPGLFACGEIIGGIHGKNRLGGNALTECVVFGRAVGTRVPISENNVQRVPVAGAGAEATASQPSQLRIIQASELAHHNAVSAQKWSALHGKVYDLTDFVDEHPGGEDSILEVAGKDGTESFANVHTETLLEDLDCIGIYEP